MKKLLVLAAGVAALGLSSCNRGSCPAYGNTRAAIHKSSPITVTAGTVAPAARL